MVTKTKRPAAKSARKRSSTTAASAAPPTEPANAPAKPNLLRAGLKALGNVRDDVVQHQSRVFEAILGVEPGQGWAGLVKRDSAAGKAAQEAFGLRKFEAVFDQRVARALEHMGMPSAEALQALSDEIAALKSEVAALRAELRSPKAAQLKR